MHYDWVILGASHAMPLDFADFNALMQRETGLRIINLAAHGTGPLYNRFVFEHFLRANRTRNLLYVVDSFAFTARAWNEDRFGDAKLIRGTPFEPALARHLGDYVAAKASTRARCSTTSAAFPRSTTATASSAMPGKAKRSSIGSIARRRRRSPSASHTSIRAPRRRTSARVISSSSPT